MNQLTISDFGVTVNQGFIYRIPTERITPVAISESLREKTRRALRDIRRMLSDEWMPPPLPFEIDKAAPIYQNNKYDEQTQMAPTFRPISVTDRKVGSSESRDEKRSERWERLRNA